MTNFLKQKTTYAKIKVASLATIPVILFFILLLNIFIF